VLHLLWMPSTAVCSPGQKQSDANYGLQYSTLGMSKYAKHTPYP
jgi:hypothetical protein